MPCRQGRKEDSMFWELTRESELVRLGVRQQEHVTGYKPGLPLSLSVNNDNNPHHHSYLL